MKFITTFACNLSSNRIVGQMDAIQGSLRISKNFFKMARIEMSTQGWREIGQDGFRNRGTPRSNQTQNQLRANT